MAIRPIITFPNPVLTTPTKSIKEITLEIKSIIKDLLETMYDAPGVGLAANQIGLSLKIAVIDIEYSINNSKTKQKNPLVLINPKIVSTEGELYEDEGCLSLPGVSERVKRFQKVTATYLDPNLEQKTIIGEGLLARALQHECDHLNGKLYIDRLSSLKREFVKKRYIKNSQESDE